MARCSRGRRGQQALEYIVTYGWAFVVVLITIGAFAYFGVFNPQKYLPDRCSFGEQLECVDYLLTAQDGAKGNVSLQLQNNFGEDVWILDVQTAEGYGGMVQTSPVAVAAGSVSTVTLNLEDSTNLDYFLLDGEKTTVPIRINFSRADPGAPTHTIIGDVFATAQATS